MKVKLDLPENAKMGACSFHRPVLRISNWILAISGVRTVAVLKSEFETFNTVPVCSFVHSVCVVCVSLTKVSNSLAVSHIFNKFKVKTRFFAKVRINVDARLKNLGLIVCVRVIR